MEKNSIKEHLEDVERFLDVANSEEEFLYLMREYHALLSLFSIELKGGGSEDGGNVL